MTQLEALAGARVFDLEQPRYIGAPSHPAHQPGYQYFLYRRHEPGWQEPRTGASGLIVTPEHSGTHIDALCHQAENLKFYGGQEVTARVQGQAGFSVLGAETIAPILARGVLLDLAAKGPLPENHVISERDLQECARRQKTELRAGDVLLVRTGFGALWSDPERYLRAAGVAARGSRWAVEHKVRAVGADNMAWDVMGPADPELGFTLPGHVLLLVRAGIHIVENLYLEELAEAGVHEFLFVCLPLKMKGATGSPVRPIALV
ncbi:MAG TPA: cyclase family protein [Candidatus Acidoferrales bacterium]|nr:cyclase family protein [Candidatus Acidoferrales bacterium]